MTIIITYAALAEQDVRDAWNYIAERNSIAADALIDDMSRAEAVLQDNPMVGVLRPDLGRAIRAWPIRSGYTFYYSYDAGSLQVLRILHHARDVRRLFQ